VLAHRRHFRELRQSWIHMIPRLCAGGVNIHCRFEDAWIVQAGRLDNHQVRRKGWQAEQARAAILAESAFCHIPAVGFRFVVFYVSCNLHSASRYPDRRGISAAARLLAIPTMTISHKRRVSSALVSYRSTQTSALSSHNTPPFHVSFGGSKPPLSAGVPKIANPPAYAHGLKEDPKSSQDEKASSLMLSHLRLLRPQSVHIFEAQRVD